MEVITLILVPAILFMLWQYQAFNEGKEEGMYYSCKYTSKNKVLRALNEHAFWTKQRALIASGFISQYAVIASIQIFDWVSVMFLTAFLGLSYILVFSFWHNGSLYTTSNLYRNPENDIPYPGGWKDDQDGKALFDFPYKMRKGMLIAGWLVFILFILMNLELCGRI
jgi:hypothetical protein